MKTRNVFIFPDNTEEHFIDTSYCNAQFNIGEKINFEGEEQAYIVSDIYNQFRRTTQHLSMIMRIVVLKKYTNKR